MGTSPGRPEMVDVELVDELDARAVAPSPLAAGSDGRRRDRRARGRRGRPGARRGRRPPRAAVAGLVLALAGGAVATALHVGGRDDQAALLAASVVDLTAPLREAWRIEAGQAPAVAGGVLLVTGLDGRDLRVRAHDARDGGLRWEHVVPRSQAAALYCRWEAGTPQRPLALCQAPGGLVPTRHAGVLAQDPGTLLVLDAREGTVLARHRLPPGHLALDTIDGALVLARLADGYVRIERVDPVTLAPAWSTRLREPVGAQPRSALLDAAGDRVALRLGPDVTVLEAGTGRRLAHWVPPGSARAAVHLTPHGTGLSSVGTSSPVSRWVHDGGVLELRGTVVEPSLSDGSAPDVVLVRPPWGSSVRGLAVEDARVLWSYDSGPREPVVRRGGLVVLAGEDRLRAVDLATGDPRWAATVPDLVAVHDVSDGTFVLVTSRTLGVGPTVSAISLRDGSLLWRVAMPHGGRSLAAVGERVLAVGAGVVVGLD